MFCPVATFLTYDFPIQIWTPPTPPQDDNDIYIDSVMMLMYDTTPMPESKLPPVYIRKEHKRLKMDPSGKRKLFFKAFINLFSRQYVSHSLTVITYLVPFRIRTVIFVLK